MTAPLSEAVERDEPDHTYITLTGAAWCSHFDSGVTHPADEPCPEVDGPPDVRSLAVDVLDDARALVSQLVDDVLPMLLHAPWASDDDRDAVRTALEAAGLAWAHLTLALTTLGADVRPAPVEVVDL